MQFEVSYRAGSRRLAVGLTLTTALVSGGPALAAGEFIDLGWIPGEVRSSEAYGVNGAGTIAVGTSVDAAAHSQAVRWDANGDLILLGTLGGRSSYATGVSLDGRRIVGTALNAADEYRAFLWTEGTGIRDIGTLGAVSARVLVFRPMADGWSASLPMASKRASRSSLSMGPRRVSPAISKCLRWA